MKYVLIGKVSKEPLSYYGRVIVHDNKEELAFLFPNERVAPLPKAFDEGMTMALKDHPDMDTILWPLAKNMSQFRK